MPVEERPFDVRLDRRPTGLVVVASGEIDLWSAPEVRDALQQGAGSVVLDLRGVTFMDSSGLGLIVSEMQLAREHAFRFGIAVRRQSDAHRILELSGLSDMLELVDDPDAFLAGGAT